MQAEDQHAHGAGVVLERHHGQQTEIEQRQDPAIEPDQAPSFAGQGCAALAYGKPEGHCRGDRGGNQQGSQQAEQLIDEASPWWPLREGIRARANASQDNPTPVSHLARNLLAAVQSSKRPGLLRLGNGSRVLPLMAALLPKRLLEALLKKRFGLNRSL